MAIASTSPTVDARIIVLDYDLDSGAHATTVFASVDPGVD